MTLLNGSLVAELRTKKGWSQLDLAQAAGITSSVVSRIERGTQADFHLSVVASLAKALYTPIDSLLTENYRVTSGEFESELQAVLNELSLKPKHIQLQAAGILRGFLGALDQQSEHK